MEKYNIVTPSFQTEPEESMVIPTQFGMELPTFESLTQEGFVMPTQGAHYEISDDVTLEFTNNEVMEMISNAVCHFPNALDLQLPNMIQVINNKIIEIANYDLSLYSVSQSNQEICDFLTMVHAGLLVFKNTVRNKPFPIKIMYISDKDTNSPYYKGTVHGPMFKGIPSVVNFSQESINSVINKFYKSHITSTNPYRDLIEKVSNKETEDAITGLEISPDDMANHLSNQEIASMVISNEITKNQYKSMVASLGKARHSNISMLVQAMRKD